MQLLNPSASASRRILKIGGVIKNNDLREDYPFSGLDSLCSRLFKYIPEVSLRNNLEHTTTYDEETFLLSFGPLDDLVSPLGHDGPRRVRAGDAIELEDRRDPRQRG